MAKRNQKFEFVAVLSRELPNHSIGAVSELAQSLMRLSASYQAIQIRECNVGLSPRDSKREESIGKKLAGLCRAFDWSVKLGGDPRGYTVHILFPSKVYNTMGGESDGWGVPTS